MAPAQVDVALEGRLDLRELHAPGGRAVDDRGGQAGGERVQEVLRRVRPGVGPEQHRRLARVDEERLAAGRVLAAGAVEALDRRAVVRAVDPAVGGAEGERGERAVGAERVERAEHLLGVDPVADRRDHLGHGAPFGAGG